MNVYTIEKMFDNYEIYELHDDEGMSYIKVVPERGGIVAEYSVKGREIFYLNKKTLYDTHSNIRGGNPIMFPICGRLEDDRYVLDGREYNMQRHGFVRHLKWTVTDQGTDDGAYIVLKVTETEESLLIYPFKFELTVKYSLRNNRLFIEQEIKNTSDVPMPFYAGFHPYFLVEDVSRMKFKIQAGRYLDLKTREVFDYFGNLDYEKEIDITFMDVESTICSIHDTQRNLKINIKYSDAFKFVNFWRINSGEFVCVDPCMGMENSMNTGLDVVQLQPGASTKAFLEIWIEKLL